MRKFIAALVFIFCTFAPAAFAEALDINTATQEQFDQSLTGVGKAKAEAIIHDREKNGPFKSIDDLVRVKGIGPATLEKNRAKITVSLAAPVTQAAVAPGAAPTK